MIELELRAHVMEEWLRLPMSRRRHATDAVAFAYRLLREQPHLIDGTSEATHALIIAWVLPHLADPANPEGSDTNTNG